MIDRSEGKQGTVGRRPVGCWKVLTGHRAGLISAGHEQEPSILISVIIFDSYNMFNVYG